MSWLAYPVTPYVFLSAGLLLCIHLFLSMKREIAGIRNASQQDQQALEKAFHDTWKRIEEVQASIKQVEELAHSSPLPAIPQPGLNINKRAQALRMHRRGETPEQIANVLAIPPNEVELLLKLHMAVTANVG